MKQVRYNDRLWFGKHKGSRVCDLIKGDPAYIQKLLKEEKIKLDDKSQNFFNERTGLLEKKRAVYGAPGGYGFDQPNRPIAARPGMPGDDEVMQVTAQGIITDNENHLRSTIQALVNEIFRGTGIGQATQNGVYHDFYNKVNRLNLPPVRLEMVMTRAQRLAEVLNARDITLHLMQEGRELIRFDLGQ